MNFKERLKSSRILFISVLLVSMGMNIACVHRSGKIAEKPLYRDPVFDGAADPVVVRNPVEKKWFMYYTNRRASMRGLDGVTWVHGTQIGIAQSEDGGATWTYRGICDIQYQTGDDTYWAPEVLLHDGVFHMYLTHVPGIFKDWSHPRHILHLTSKDGIKWTYESTLPLANDKVIDACVHRLPDGSWRLWYNNEKDRKSIYYADSPDLYTWVDRGKAVGDQSGEGPAVFQWQGAYWMITDVWQGLACYRSSDLTHWQRIPGNLLQTPGTGLDDGVKGGHADVIVNQDRAYLFYFTHPGRVESVPETNSYEKRRSSIQVAELRYENGRITCDRNASVIINLKPPEENKGVICN
ncbi:family 43 glycosylhydrolase [bacterium]|nr:family 43 glycosylhydrolase [bacterium]